MQNTFAEITLEGLAAEFSKDIPLATATAAHSGTSWTPEKRGAARVAEYGQTLAHDYLSLASLPGAGSMLEEEFARYREGYRRRYLAMLHSNARCVSWAIAGPSNFPAARMQKRADIAHRRLNDLCEFRERALKAIRRALNPEAGPIMAGQDNALDLLERKLAEAERLHERMTTINAAHKRFLKDPASLDSSGLADTDKDDIRKYKPAYSWEPHPYAPYQLSNSNARIRDIKKRIASISAAKAAPVQAQWGESRIRYEDNPGENRVRLFFPGKPDADVRTHLKTSGFRWAPTLGCWQAYRNHRTVEVAKKAAGVA